MIGLCKMLWVQADQEAYPNLPPSLPFRPVERKKASLGITRCSQRYYELLDACPLRMGPR